MNPVRYEFCVEFGLRPRMLWVAALLAFLALPRVAGTAEIIEVPNFLSSPSGVFPTLTTTGQTMLGAMGADRPLVTLVGGSNSGGRVGIGVAKGEFDSPPLPLQKMIVAGNIQVSGCFYINDSKRCKW